MNRIRSLSGQLNNAMAQYQRSSAAASGAAGGPPPGYRYDKSTSSIEFQASEKVKVRTMVLPSDFDEKGEIKKYTADELKKLKGDHPNLAGYDVTPDQITPGSTVEVTLTFAKKAKTETSPTKEVKDKDAPKEKDAPAATAAKKNVTLVMLLEKGNAPAAQQPKKKAK